MSRSRGFSLIEVIAALAVVAFGMLGVIEAVSQTASSTAYMRDKTLAHWVAMNRLTELRLAQQAPKIAKTSDEVEMAGRRWRWTTEVTQSPLESVRRIDVSVRLADGKEDSFLAKLTGFYGSAIAPPGTTVVMWQGSEAGGPGGEGGDGEVVPRNDPRKKPPPPDDDAPPGGEPEPQLQPETTE